MFGSLIATRSSALDALCAQRCGREGGPAVELAVRDPLALEQQRHPLGMLGRAVREDVGEVHERRSCRGDERPRRSQVATSSSLKAGPKSGLTWQFWILPAHIESSWRPWWFVRER